MGNEGPVNKQQLRQFQRRKDLLLPAKGEKEKQPYVPSKRKYSTINQSLEIPQSTPPKNGYNSIDYSLDHAGQVRSIRSEPRSHEDIERDKILQKLSQKNEQLRRQLKKISEQLSEQLKRKKFVPKKRQLQNEQQDDRGVANAGLRRQLQNGYRQIEMYKRTIEALKGKEQTNESDNKIKRLDNSVAEIDAQINTYIKRIEGIKKVKKNQDKVIQKDINDDLVGGVDSLKKEAEEIKNSLKEFVKRERQREINYKKQQAYLLQVEKKLRQMNGEYFPEIKKKIAIGSLPQTKPKQYVDNSVSPKDFDEVNKQLIFLRAKHEEYHKKIDSLLQQKNKISQEQASLDEHIRYNDKVIETLRMKLIEIKKIIKPTKKSLFGYDNYQGTELQSEVNGGASEIEKQIEEQVNQDQFDIKHLMANIPKPIRLKPVEFVEDKKEKGVNNVRREVSDKAGMVISNQKSQPKKWGSSLTRSEEKGRIVRKETTFEDANAFEGEAKPLIIGINIWVNKNNIILGLQAIYLNNDEIRYGSKSSATLDGFLQRYDLQSPDYLKNVTGAFSEEGYLEYLMLYSKKGKVATFGFKHQGQQQFNFGLSSAQRPFRFFGASFMMENEFRVNRLGIDICQEN